MPDQPSVSDRRTAPSRRPRDRRAARRYWFTGFARYRDTVNPECTGPASVIDFGETSVRFDTAMVMNWAGDVVLSVAALAARNHRYPVELVVEGPVVRREDRTSVLEIRSLQVRPAGDVVSVSSPETSTCSFLA